MKAVTYQSGDAKIRICPECETALLASGTWPKDRRGRDLTDVHRGLSRGHCDTHLRVRLREARERAGISQVQLAEALGVPQQSISKWEHGQDPTTTALARIAETLGVTTDWLLGLVHTREEGT